MLSIDQYQTLLGTVPDINKELRKNGVKIGDEEAEPDADEEKHVDSDEKPTKVKEARKEKPTSTDKKLKGKSNIEATSDEAEEDSE